MLRVMRAFSNTRASCAVPSHHADANIKHMSQSQVDITICVGCPLLPINLGCLLELTTQGI